MTVAHKKGSFEPFFMPFLGKQNPFYMRKIKIKLDHSERCLIYQALRIMVHGASELWPDYAPHQVHHRIAELTAAQLVWKTEFHLLMTEKFSIALYPAQWATIYSALDATLDRHTNAEKLQDIRQLFAKIWPIINRIYYGTEQ